MPASIKTGCRPRQGFQEFRTLGVVLTGGDDRTMIIRFVP